MEKDKLQPQRFELKYLVNEDVALAMRDFVRSYLVPDEFASKSPTLSYPNHSVYLDSDDLRMYWDVINGNKNRYKLRLRFYDDNAAAPVFFEIKRRSDNAILKERGAVRRDFVATLLAGQLPEPGHLVSSNPKHLTALQNFCRLMHECHAHPKTHVCYKREAWMSVEDNSVRVTFDREVYSCPHTEPVITTQMRDSVKPWGEQVILELKFTGRFPNWFFEMVRLFNVMQCGVAKYAEGVAVLGEERLNPLFHQPASSDRVERFLREHRNPRQSRKSAAENDGNLVWTTS
jgi:hypothetical protein